MSKKADHQLDPGLLLAGFGNANIQQTQHFGAAVAVIDYGLHVQLPVRNIRGSTELLRRPEACHKNTQKIPEIRESYDALASLIVSVLE